MAEIHKQTQQNNSFFFPAPPSLLLHWQCRLQLSCPRARHEGVWRGGYIAPHNFSLGTKWGGWSDSLPGQLSAREKDPPPPNSHRRRVSVGPRAGLDALRSSRGHKSKVVSCLRQEYI